MKMYEMGDEGRHELGAKGRTFVEKTFNFDTYAETWDDLIMRLHEELGSWDTRTGYQPYEVREF